MDEVKNSVWSECLVWATWSSLHVIHFMGVL